MPEKQRVIALIDRVVSGDYVGAIRDFYHQDATMQENAGLPRVGQEALIAHEIGILDRFHMRTHPVDNFLVDGDRAAICWTFDMTDREGITRRLEEVTIQRWHGDRIAEERFFYDPELPIVPALSCGEPAGDA